MHNTLEFIINNFREVVKCESFGHVKRYQIRAVDDSDIYINVYVSVGEPVFKVESFISRRIWIDLPINIEPEFHEWLKLIFT